MRRRALLQTCGACLAAAAGCLSGSTTDGSPADTSPDTPTETRFPSPTGSPAPTTDLSVSVEALQPVVVEQASADSIAVSDSQYEQFLRLHVRVTAGSPPAIDELAFRFDGTAHRPLTDVRGLWYAYQHGNSRYTADRGAGWLLFELPDSGDASGAALTWPGGEWTPATSLRRRLAAQSPPLSLSWSVPETVAVGDTPTLSFTVTNEGDVDGRFVGALNRTGPSIAHAPIAAVSRSVPAGASTTFDVTDTLDVGDPGAEEVGDGAADATYVLSWQGGRRSRDVRTVNES